MRLHRGRGALQCRGGLGEGPAVLGGVLQPRDGAVLDKHGGGRAR